MSPSWLAQFWALLAVAFGQQTTSRPPTNVTACMGTSNGLTIIGSQETRYSTYRNNYAGCAYVIGNLEIIMPGMETDFSFLNSIREVTGYVLIYMASMAVLPLPQLKIIRGEETFKYQVLGVDRSCSLFLAFNPKLRTLNMTSLREISHGDVCFNANLMLSCHATSTVNWADIFAKDSQNAVYTTGSNQTTECRGSCDASCEVMPRAEVRHCWGPGPGECQRLNKLVCASQCDHRCFGPQPRDCCHSECLGGCSGPTASDCWGCRNFYNDGVCERNCPQMQVYDKNLYDVVDNPNKKYSFGNLCVKSCPGNYVLHNGGCIRMCPEGYRKDNQSVCIQCASACPKACRVNFTDDYYVTSLNIKLLANCTHVNGNIILPSISFENDEWDGVAIPALTPTDLAILTTIREVTGYVSVQPLDVEWVKNVSFLSSLEEIGGTQLFDATSALDIQGHYIEFLGLRSLRRISTGMVNINAPRQCYTRSQAWLAVMRDSVRMLPQVNDTACGGITCDGQCADGLCWGPGSDMCLRCKHHRLPDGRCVANCSNADGYYEHISHSSPGRGECRRCHSECSGACTGPSPRDCNQCRHMRSGLECVSQCPEGTYLTAVNGSHVCLSCHPHCKGGCSGPSATVGTGGCKSCHKAVMKSFSMDFCISLTAPCPRGYFNSTLLQEEQSGGTLQCAPCHDQCETCTWYGSDHCLTCKHYNRTAVNGFYCTSSCTEDEYEYVSLQQDADRSPAEVREQSKMCRPCHKNCRNGCRGVTDSDCKQCNGVRLMKNDSSGLFACVTDCPPEAPYVQKDNEDQLWCSKEQLSAAHAQSQHTNAAIVSGSVIGSICFIVVIIAILWQRYMRRRRTKATISSSPSTESLKPSDARPDLAQLILVKESDIIRGGIIGSGAFGTVFKGIWKPEGQNIKIPVAIKVLQEGTTPDQNAGLLEEARVMVSVQHPCCVRILAVCLAAQMALITQLMPLGCLLEYVRKNRANIGSKTLLTWCTQIAQGMEYLEQRGIVHRDLAARNVLVHTPRHVKITDFGLAKVLDPNEVRYYAHSGKMPVKWMALESVQHKVFTHKTDVWSYGVTIWELFTYGQKPYDSVPARSIPLLLEKGERLPQPAICTIDVFMVMIKCWMLDADSRPNFTSLALDFARMAKDPRRYLVIEGDRQRTLPSAPYDPRLLLSGEDDDQLNDEPGDLMEADDYLKPTTVTSTASETSMSALDMAAARMAPAYQGAESKDPLDEEDNDDAEDDELLPPQSPDSRYAPTPVRLMSASDCESPHGESQQFLPLLDEAGYLHPQSSSDEYLNPKYYNRPPYLDIIPEHGNIIKGNGAYANLGLEGATSARPAYVNMADSTTTAKQSLCITTVDNPDYFLTPDQSQQWTLSNAKQSGQVRGQQQDYLNTRDGFWSSDGEPAPCATVSKDSLQCSSMPDYTNVIKDLSRQAEGKGQSAGRGQSECSQV